MELLQRSHSNVKELREVVGRFLENSDSGISLFEKIKGIVLVIPQGLLIVKNEDESVVRWTEFKEGLAAWANRLNCYTSAEMFVIPRWLQSGQYGLNFNIINLLDDVEWNRLYVHLGTTLMNTIFKQCQIFLPLSKTSYLALHCERTLIKLNELPSQSQSYIRSCKEPTTFNLNSILYGQKKLRRSFDEYDEADLLEKIIQDILAQNVGCELEININVIDSFKRSLLSFLERCLKIENCKLILLNICNKARKEDNGKVKAATSLKSEAKKRKLSQAGKACIGNKSSAVPRKRKPKKTLKPVPLNSVRKFLKKYLSKIIPNNMFGKQKYQITRKILSVLKYGKNQCFSINEILENISISKIPCVKSSGNATIQRSLIAKLIIWLLKKWVFTLIGVNFYVTERRNTFNKLHYYKKKSFNKLIFGTVYCLKKMNTWSKINSTSIKVQQNKINRSSGIFRIIPKGNFGARPVIWNKIPNNLTEECRVFLNQLSLLKAKNVRSQTNNTLHELWSAMYEKWNDRGRYSLYFVKLDIFDAYGSIILEKLFSIIKNLLKDFLGMIQINMTKITYRKFKCFTSNGNSYRCRYLWRFEELPPSVPAHSIIVPTSQYKTFELEELLKVANIECLLKDVKMGNAQYVITKGVPQGGTLSAAFCQIYYDRFDRQYLAEFLKNENDIFIRAVDDYLFVTPCIERAKRFLGMMENGCKEFGVTINAKKTSTNFGPDSTEIIPFYGYLLNTKTMEISGNYDIYSGIGIFHTLSFRKRSNPGSFLKERMRNIASLKLHLVALDPHFNGKSTILLTVYRAATLMAFRFHAIVKNLLKQYNSTFLIECINICASCIASRVSRITTVQIGEPPIISREEARYLVFVSFIDKLSRFKTEMNIYIDVLNILMSQVRNTSPKFKNYIQELIEMNSQDDPFKGTY